MVRKKCPSSQSNLWEVLQEAWGKISSDYLNELTARMPKVCKAVIAANGEFFDESIVWRTKLLFRIKIIISNLVNVLTIFSIHFANQLMNTSMGFHGKHEIVWVTTNFWTVVYMFLKKMSPFFKGLKTSLSEHELKFSTLNTFGVEIKRWTQEKCSEFQNSEFITPRCVKPLRT